MFSFLLPIFFLSRRRRLKVDIVVVWRRLRRLVSHYLVVDSNVSINLSQEIWIWVEHKLTCLRFFFLRGNFSFWHVFDFRLLLLELNFWLLLLILHLRLLLLILRLRLLLLVLDLRLFTNIFWLLSYILQICWLLYFLLRRDHASWSL